MFRYETVKRVRFLQVVSALAISALTLALASPSIAEVEVVLKSGTSLVGEVKIDGEAAIVTIDGSELRVPLSEIASIASSKSGPDRQARRLLLSALEARLTDEGGVEVIGLLAEASRLAPDDPHIAYWYARSLADAGYGQAANDVLQRDREAIAKEYPGMIEQLADRIKKRVDMEKMPPVLVERLDNLNAELAKQSPGVDQPSFAVVFRLVDDEKQPIERSAFQVYSNNSQEENLEPFDDGYYLYTFKRHRNNGQHPIHVEITQPGLVARTIAIDCATNRVKDAGELEVKRYAEDAKVAFRVNLVDPDRKPIVGARVTLQPVSSRGGTGGNALSTETDDQGWAEVLVFPMTYSYNAQADGFNSTGGRAEIKAGTTDKNERFQQMFRTVRATLRLAWESASPQGGGKSNGETTLQFGGESPGNPYGQNAAGWLRPFQQENRLSLQFNDTFFGYGPFGQPPEPWLRVLDPKARVEIAPEEAIPGEDEPKEAKPTHNEGTDADNGEADGLEVYNDLTFNDIEKLKEKLPQPRMSGGGQPHGPRPPMVLPAEVGKIYIGRLQHRDMRGQPVQLTFKVYVEDISTDDEAGE